MTGEASSREQSPLGRKSFLVTGGSGFIGHVLVKALLRLGARVRSLDNDSRGSRNRFGELARDLEIITGDIRDPDAVRRATQGVDCVCHLAFVNGTKYFYSMPEVVLDVALRGISNIIGACIENNVPEMTLASSSEVYQTPPAIPTDETAPLMVPDALNPRYSYAGGKIISELMAINFGRKHLQRVTIFRPHNVYGPCMGTEHVIPQLVLRMAELCRETSDPVRLPIQGTGKETRAFVYIDDLVDGVLRVMEKGEHLGIYHIGTQEEITIEELAGKIGVCFGRQVQIVPGPAAPGSTPRRCPDITKMRKLGYRPRISLEEGLERTVSWYRSACKGPATVQESA